jgi:amidophosphoribosyltransferase
VRSLRNAGAKEIHMLISCPPTCHPCYYGIDFPSSTELIAGHKSLDEIRDYLNLDSLIYLSLDGLVEATGLEKDTFCLACFNGEYPVEPDRNFKKLALSNSCACAR